MADHYDDDDGGGGTSAWNEHIQEQRRYVNTDYSTNYNTFSANSNATSTYVQQQQPLENRRNAVRQRVSQRKTEAHSEVTEEDEPMPPQPQQELPHRPPSTIMRNAERFFELSVIVITYYIFESIGPLKRFAKNSNAHVELSHLNRRLVLPLWFGWLIVFIKALFFLSVFISMMIGASYLRYNLTSLFSVGTDKGLLRTKTVLPAHMVQEYISDFSRAKPMTESRSNELLSRMDPSNSRSLPAIAEGVNEDGNEAGDASEFEAALEIMAEVMRDNEMADTINYKRQQQQAPTIIPAPIVSIPHNQTCAGFTQFNFDSQDLFLRYGCYDLLQLSLDIQFNNMFVANQFARLLREVSVGKGKGGNAFLERENMVNLGIAYDNMKKRVGMSNLVGNHPHNCVCSAHFGIVDLWAYYGFKGENSSLAIDYDIVPLLEGEDMDAFKNMRKLRFNFVDTPMHQTHDQFVKTLHVNDAIKQPTNGIRINTKTIPSKEVLTDYYGKTYGDSFTAWHMAMSVIKDNKKNSENDEKKWFFIRWLNSFGHWLASGWLVGDPAMDDDLINKKILDSRRKAAWARTSIQKQQAKDGEGGVVERALGIAKSLGLDIATGGSSGKNNGQTSVFPGLVFEKNKFIPDPHAACLSSCLLLHKGLLHERQCFFNKVNGVKSPTLEECRAEAAYMGFQYVDLHSIERQKDRQQQKQRN